MRQLEDEARFGGGQSNPDDPLAGPYWELLDWERMCNRFKNIARAGGCLELRALEAQIDQLTDQKLAESPPTIVPSPGGTQP